MGKQDLLTSPLRKSRKSNNREDYEKTNDVQIHVTADNDRVGKDETAQPSTRLCQKRERLIYSNMSWCCMVKLTFLTVRRRVTHLIHGRAASCCQMNKSGEKVSNMNLASACNTRLMCAAHSSLCSYIMNQNHSQSAMPLCQQNVTVDTAAGNRRLTQA